MKWKRNARITARTRVENFIYIESIIQHSRECAFTILNRHKSNFQWICDFIGNTNSIVDHLTLIDGGFLEKNERTYDLGRDTIKITFTKYDECCSNIRCRSNFSVFTFQYSIPNFRVNKRLSSYFQPPGPSTSPFKTLVCPPVTQSSRTGKTWVFNWSNVLGQLRI